MIGENAGCDVSGGETRSGMSISRRKCGGRFSGRRRTGEAIIS